MEGDSTLKSVLSFVFIFLPKGISIKYVMAEAISVMIGKVIKMAAIQKLMWSLSAKNGNKKSCDRLSCIK